MSVLTPRDRKLLGFVQNKMRATGAIPTFQAIRLRFGFPSEEHAKQAFTNLIEHLTHIFMSSSSSAAIIRGDS